MTYSVMPFFGSKVYDEKLIGVTLPIGMLAQAMAAELPNCEETAAGLRKLLEAQDCFLRAAQLGQLIQEPVDELDFEPDFDPGVDNG